MISPGPVFQAECMTTARRRRYYVIRFLYGLLLLSIVSMAFQAFSWVWSSVGPYNGRSSALADMANSIFMSFVAAQVLTVLCVTPAMVAGTIADEKQRKTLHYLLASQLSSLEIVGGKLAARMLHLIVLISAGLPIISILGLIGGVDPVLVVVSFLGTLTTAYAIAGMAIFVSTLANRARDAIIIAYGILIALLLVPSVLPATLSQSAPGLADWISTITSPIVRLDPFQLLSLTEPKPDLALNLAMMAVGHVVIGSLFMVLGVFCLRPAFGRGGRVRTTAATGPARKRRFWSRPEVSDVPMVWKECHVTSLPLFIRISVGLVAVFIVVFIGDAMIDYTRDALGELWKYGYGDGGRDNEHHRARNAMQEFVASMATACYFLWVIGIATSAASGISSEREEDTWLSLLGTTLSGQAILVGKAIGAAWRWRFLAIISLLLWTTGVIVGAIHPIGYVATLMGFTAYSAFALALGSFLSMRAKSTARATVVTILILLTLNVGYLFCAFPMGLLESPMITLPSTPVMMAIAPAQYHTIEALLGDYPGTRVSWRHDSSEWLTTFVMSIVFYSAAAAGLTTGAIQIFDRVADRPTRPQPVKKLVIGEDSET